MEYALSPSSYNEGVLWSDNPRRERCACKLQVTRSGWDEV